MEPCPGNAKTAGGISEKSDWGKLHRVLRQKDFNRNKKDSKGQSRKKGLLKSHVTEEGQSHPQGSSKIELSGK